MSNDNTNLLEVINNCNDCYGPYRDMFRRKWNMTLCEMHDKLLTNDLNR